LSRDSEIIAQLYLISHKTGLKFEQAVGKDCDKKLDRQIQRGKNLVQWLLSNCTCAAIAIDRTISGYCESQKITNVSATRLNSGIAEISHFSDLLSREYEDHLNKKSNHASGVCHHGAQVPQAATVSFDSYFSHGKENGKENIRRASPSRSGLILSTLPNKTSRKTNDCFRRWRTDCETIQHQNVPVHLKSPNLLEDGTATSRTTNQRHHPVESGRMAPLLSHIR